MLRNIKNALLFLMIQFSVISVEAEAKIAVDLLGASNLRSLADSNINSGNQVLHISKSSLDLEIRPDFKWTPSEKFNLIARGRWLGSHESYDFQQSRDQGHLDLTDFYFNWEMLANTRFAIGLQNFQWGPGELYSPSNPFFHFNSQQKSFFYKEKGRALIRLAIDLSKHLQAMVITEPVDNNDKYWIEDKVFNAKSAVKFEYTFTNKANYLAVLLGSEELYQPFLGEYMNWALTDAASFYFDLRQTQGVANYLPKDNVYGSYDLVSSENLSSVRTLSLVGFRWEESTWDLRIEYVNNSNGYTHGEWNQIKQSLTTLVPTLSANLRRFFRPGLEFYTQNYFYTSLRLPDLFIRDQNIYFRNLLSQLDSSGFFQLDLDEVMSDNTVFYFEHMQFYGPKNSEFHSVNDYQISVGLKYSI